MLARTRPVPETAATAIPPRVSPFDRESLSQIDARNRDGRPVAELLPWLFPYNEKMLVNKDSAVMAVYECDGPDADGMSMGGVMELLNNKLASLRDLARKPVTIWWTVHRRNTDEYETMPMPDPVSQIVDDERRKSFEESGNYINRHYVSICLAPEIGLDRFAGRFMHGISHDGLSVPASLYQAARAMFSDQYIFAWTATELTRAIEIFERDLKGFISSNPRLTFRRLDNDALGAFLHNCCSPPSDHVESLALPDTPALDVDLCDTNVQPGHDYLHFYSNGRCRIGVAAGIPSARDFWPDNASIKSLDGLLKIRGELTISHCYRLATQSRAKRFLVAIRKFHESRQVDLRSILGAAMRGTSTEGARQNEARTKAAKDANRQAGKAEMSEEIYGDYNLSIISYSPIYTSPFDPEERVRREQQAYDEAVAVHTQVEDVLRGAQFLPLRETFHALSAFATTIPGMWRDCERWIFLRARVLTRLLPLRGVSAGHLVNQHLTKETGTRCTALAPFMTEFGTPFWFIAFVLDVGHMLICGRTGYGKTIFMLLCATLFRKYPFAQFIGFDRDLSMFIPTLLQGGHYLRYGDDASALERAHINPLSLLAEDRHLAFLMRWVELTARQRNNYQATDDDRAAIEKALTAMRKRPRDFWRLSTLQTSLPTGPLSKALAGWAGESFDAHWFDNVQDAFEESGLEGGWIAMATDAILKDKAVARPFLSYVTYRIRDAIEQRRKQGIIGPTVVLLPEIWNLLDDDDFARQIGDWIVTMRKLLGCVWMDAQSPEQVAESKIWPAIRDNVLVRVFVPVEKFTMGTRRAYEEHFGLSNGQIKVIKKLVAKRDYLITEQSGASRRVSVELDPRTVAILRSESSAQILFQKHLDSAHPDWRQNYIAEAVERIEADKRVSTANQEEKHAA